MPKACLTTGGAEAFQELQEERQGSLPQLNLKQFLSRDIFKGFWDDIYKEGKMKEERKYKRSVFVFVFCFQQSKIRRS